MSRITTLLLGAGLVALQGCSAAPSDEPLSSSQENVTGGNATLSFTSDWGMGYCAQVTVTNSLVPAQATTRWQVLLDLKSNITAVTSSWSASFSKLTGISTVTPVNYNTSIPAGGSVNFGWCANTSSTLRPVIKAWNMEANSFPTCETGSGLFPAMASLAVAMGTELGRFQPIVDLNNITNQPVTVSSTGLARCSNGCANTKAILGQQAYSPDMSVFNNANYQSQLQAAFSRQTNNITNLLRNNQSQMPPGHKLTLVGGPTNLGIGACGPHYIFQVDYDVPPSGYQMSYTNSKAVAGQPLSATDAANMVQDLCYFNQGSCGNNTYIGFVTNPAGCPSGKTCIAIDPTDGDNGSTSTTSAGSAPSYPGNRVYDPANDLLGTQCITASGLLGTMTSKCAAVPNTCGFLYCIPN